MMLHVPQVSSSACFVFAPVELYFGTAWLMCYSGCTIILCRKLKYSCYVLVNLQHLRLGYLIPQIIYKLADKAFV
jgi:hypothetical protein